MEKVTFIIIFTSNSKKIIGQNMLAFKDILGQEIDLWCITKVELNIIMLFGLFDCAHTL
jgi:hypothetical protein